MNRFQDRNSEVPSWSVRELEGDIDRSNNRTEKSEKRIGRLEWELRRRQPPTPVVLVESGGGGGTSFAMFFWVSYLVAAAIIAGIAGS